jgi:hypothetical protein
MDTPAPIFVPAHYESTARDRLAALTKRADRLGVPAPLVTWGELVWRHRSDAEYRAGAKTWPFREVYITGAPVTLDGWTLAAAVDLLDAEQGIAVVRCGWGVKGEAAWGEGAERCDHCGTARRRTVTYIVTHPAEGWKRVGASCLADFMPRRARDAVAVAAWFADVAQWIEEAGADDDDAYRDGGAARGFDGYQLSDVLPLAAAVVRVTGGYVSRKKADELCRRSTTDLLSDELHPPRNRPEWRPLDVTDEDRALADAALEYARTLEPSSDYERNLSALARAGYGQGKHLAYIASMLPAYQSHVTREAEKARARAGVRPIHVGAVGGKIDLPVTVERVVRCEGVYGTSFLHIMRAHGGDLDGAVLTWFCTGARPDFPMNAPARIKGTVKAHEVREGRPQTLLTRVRLA